MKKLSINFIGAVTAAKSSLISGGIYDGKYLIVSPGYPSAIEVDGSDLKFNLPDIYNFNTTGVYEVVTGSQSNKSLNTSLSFDKKNGIEQDGSLLLTTTPYYFIIADNLTDGELFIVFFSQNSANPYSKYTIYHLSGVASDYIS